MGRFDRVNKKMKTTGMRSGRVGLNCSLAIAKFGIAVSGPTAGGIDNLSRLADRCVGKRKSFLHREVSRLRVVMHEEGGAQ